MASEAKTTMGRAALLVAAIGSCLFVVGGLVDYVQLYFEYAQSRYANDVVKDFGITFAITGTLMLILAGTLYVISRGLRALPKDDDRTD